MTFSRDIKPSSTTPAPPRQKGDQPVRAEEAANQLVSRSGTQLPPEVRQPLEAQFDANFSHVRVHSDRPAAEAANALGARAFTLGRHIAFNQGEYKPGSAGGRRLLAHELAHVLQQSGAGNGRAAVVRDTVQEHQADVAADRAMQGRSVQADALAKGGAPRIQAEDQKPNAGKTGAAQNAAAQPAGTTVTIVLRAPDDQYTKDVTDYVMNTLKEQVIEVDNIEEAADKVAAYAKANKIKVTTVRIIGHGSTTGGIKMTPKGETGRRFVSAEELEKMAADDKVKAKDAMAEGSIVEFWGCYIGGTDKATQAVGQIFGSDVKSLESELQTAHDSFLRQADKGETGDSVKGQQGKWREVPSTKEIDDRVAKGNKALGESFNKWLIAQAKTLEADGDLPPQPDDAARIATMRDLFDRSGGKIKRLQIKTSGGDKVHRGDKKRWLQQWKVKKK